MIDLTFITGKIAFDNLSSLKNIDLCDQIESLKEDLLQVEYPTTLLLDVGWYPSFDITGCFQIRVIKDFDWSTPLFLSNADSIESLIDGMLVAQKVIHNGQ
ncbi:hypothetical protein J2Y74_001663 [Pseudomonas migulae]|uniref:hypothetical protein n=1 Tax=Pseudomonas migulae TaxID=78543 RepID=UPI00209EF03D|nr:hypothetical protein [Pseudomonas migulae]